MIVRVIKHCALWPPLTILLQLSLCSHCSRAAYWELQEVRLLMSVTRPRHEPDIYIPLIIWQQMMPILTGTRGADIWIIVKKENQE